MQIVFLSLAAILAGAAVSFAGLLGFIGLIVPHFVRMFLPANKRFFVIIIAVFGAVFCLFCDLLARTAFSPYELPVGIIMSLIGEPFFIYLLMDKKKGRME